MQFQSSTIVSMVTKLLLMMSVNSVLVSSAVCMSMNKHGCPSWGKVSQCSRLIECMMGLRPRRGNLRLVSRLFSLM